MKLVLPFGGRHRLDAVRLDAGFLGSLSLRGISFGRLKALP